MFLLQSNIRVTMQYDNAFSCNVYASIHQKPWFVASLPSFTKCLLIALVSLPARPQVDTLQFVPFNYFASDCLHPSMKSHILHLLQDCHYSVTCYESLNHQNQHLIIPRQFGKQFLCFFFRSGKSPENKTQLEVLVNSQFKSSMYHQVLNYIIKDKIHTLTQ